MIRENAAAHPLSPTELLPMPAVEAARRAPLDRVFNAAIRSRRCNHCAQVPGNTGQIILVARQRRVIAHTFESLELPVHSSNAR